MMQKFQEIDHRLLSLEVFGKSNQISNARNGELIKGDIVKGGFYSKYPNLGQLAVRFNNNNHDSEDIVLFRIKEEKSQDWYFQAEYKTDQFLPHKLFPFGFPVIKDSKDKTYYFEIESLLGVNNKGISVDSGNPIFTAKGIFTKAELISDYRILFYYIVHKASNLLHYLPIFLFAFSPLMFYVLLYFTSIVKPILYLTAITLVTLSSAINPSGVDNNSVVIVLFMFALFSNKNNYESRISLFFSSIYLLLALIFLFVNLDYQANIFAIWCYVFMWITAIQLTREKYFGYLPTTTLGKFLSRD
jgi:hypothetical protein